MSVDDDLTLVLLDATTELVIESPVLFEVAIPGLQGPPGVAGAPGQNATIVSTTNPGLTAPGLWVQTGLGTDGTGITFWVEDGT